MGNDGNAQLNPQALGNAWFVDEISYVDNADAEMDALSTLDPASQAVAERRFAQALGKARPTAPSDTIFETSYAPDRLTYAARSANGGIAVFSEIYFPWGWETTIDGNPAELGRVNYVLRALRIPAGNHTVEMRFNPASVRNTVAAARFAVVAIYLLLALAIVASLLPPASQCSKASATANYAGI